MIRQSDSVVVRALSRPTIPLKYLQISLASPLLPSDRRLNAAHLHQPYQIETTSSSWQIRVAHQHLVWRNACRSILRPFNATSAPRNSHEPTICVLIFVHIPMKDPLYAMSAPKPLPVSTIENDTRGCTVVRKSSSVRASLAKVVLGAAGADSHAPTH